MDPVTTLGLAAGVLQFVQFSSDIFKTAYRSYRTLQQNDADAICERLKDLSNELDKSLQSAAGPTTSPSRQAPQSAYDREETLLHNLARDCREDCHKLATRLSVLRKRSSPQQFWASFKDALNGSLSSGQDSLRQIQDRIKQYESTLTVHMCAVMLRSGKQLQRQLQDLVLATRSSSSDFEHQFRSLDSKVTKVLEEIQRITKSNGEVTNEGMEMNELAARLKMLSLDTIHVQNEKKTDDILTSLDYPQRSARHEAVPDAHAQTFGWALQRPEVRTLESNEAQGVDGVVPNRGKLLHWLETGTGVFWVSGKPGSGKSTFMKYVADHPATKQALRTWAIPRYQNVIILSHYFWSPGSSMQKSQHGLWRSLLLGMLRQAPDLVPEVCEELWNQPDTQYLRGHDWSLAQLRKNFECFAKLDTTKYRFCVFIDGLDEFDGDHSDMVETLLELSGSPHVKLCTGSRPWNVFETGFGESAHHKIYMQDLNYEDILKYTQNRLKGLSRNRWAHSVTEEERETLIRSVSDRAEGVFLWAFLVTKYLREGLDNGDTFGNLRAMLQTFPPELEPFFKQILDGVAPTYHRHMAGFLRLSIVARRPCNLMVYHFHEMELNDADFVANLPVRPLGEAAAARLRCRMVMRLNGLSKGLLEVDQRDDVQFIHRTVRDWLASGPMETYLEQKTRACWNGTTSLLHGHLGWFKCPQSRNSFLEPLTSAFSYGDLICEYNEANGTTAINRIVDEFLSVTTELRTLGYILDDTRICDPCAPGRSVSLVMFQARLLESGLWDYLSAKLDQGPGYLDGLAEQDRFVEDFPLTCLDPWSDREACVRSKIITAFLASFLHQKISGWKTDPVRSILTLTWQQANRVSRTVQRLVEVGADLNPSHTLIGIQPREWAGLLILALRTVGDYDDQFQFQRDMIAKLDPKEQFLLVEYDTGVSVWDIFCAQVAKLREVPEMGSFVPVALFLKHMIHHLSQSNSSRPQPSPYQSGLSWAKLKTALEQCYPGRLYEEWKCLTDLIDCWELFPVNDPNIRNPQETKTWEGQFNAMLEGSEGASQKRGMAEDQPADTPRKRARALSLSYVLCS